MNDPVQTQGQGRVDWRRYWPVAAAAVVLFGVAILVIRSRGGNSSTSSQGSRQAGSPQNLGFEDEILRQALRNLNQIEKFDSEEVFRQTMDRFNLWLKAQPPWTDWRLDPMAEPLVKAAAGFAAELKPINEAMRKPMERLDLKSIAGQLESAVGALAKLARRRSLSELAELERRYEEFLQEVAHAVKQFPDAARRSARPSCGRFATG